MERSHDEGRDIEIGWSFDDLSSARGRIKDHHEGFSGTIAIR